jgi:hypothetical protein
VTVMGSPWAFGFALLCAIEEAARLHRVADSAVHLGNIRTSDPRLPSDRRITRLDACIVTFHAAIRLYLERGQDPSHGCHRRASLTLANLRDIGIGPFGIRQPTLASSVSSMPMTILSAVSSWPLILELD